MMNHTMTLILITIIVALSIALIVAIAQISVFRKMTRSLNDIVMNAHNDLLHEQHWSAMYVKLFRHSFQFDKSNYELISYENEFAVVNRSKDGSTIIETFAFDDDDESKEYARVCADELFEALTTER